MWCLEDVNAVRTEDGVFSGSCKDHPFIVSEMNPRDSEHFQAHMFNQCVAPETSCTRLE